MAVNVATAQKYLEERNNLNNDAVIALVADDIILISGRDGTHSGKEAFKAYLAKVVPTGKWDDAQFDEKRGKVIINGKVKIVLINFSVVSVFDFNQEGKINKIVISRA